MEDESGLPPRPPAPSDPEVLHTIQKLAEYVVKQGTRFEDHTRRDKANDPQFDFLFGRDTVGFHFYEWTKRSLALKRPEAENTPEEEPSPPGTSSKKDRRSRGDSDMNEKESKKMRHASPPPDHSQSNGDGPKKKSSGDPRRDQEMKLHADPRREYPRGDTRETKDPRREQQLGDTRREHGDMRRQLGRDQDTKQHGETKRHGDPRHEQYQADPRRDQDVKQLRREPGIDEAGRETERKRARSPEQRKRNRTRSRSPHRRNSRSPRRRSRSKSPVREHKRGDPRANAARSREICYDYSRGRCNKGSSCKYIHEEPDERGKRDEWGGERQRNSRESRDRESRDPRGDPRHNHSRDPRDYSKDPRDSSRDPRDAQHHREHREEENQQRGVIEDKQNSQPSQQSDWNNFQPLNQWPQGLASIAPNAGYLQNGSMAASLQALQEQHFQLPPPPPPPPLAGLEALAVKVSAAPLVNPSGLFMEGHPKQQEDGQTNEDTEKKSPDNRQPAGDSDDNQNGEGDGEEGTNHKGKKSSMLVRLAVTEYVKEVLKPTWKGGHMSKEVYKTIAKKAVDKVIGTLQSHQIPRTPEKVEHFMDFSRQKISKLVQGYVEKYNK